MSADIDSLERSMGRVDVETRRVSPDGVAAAVDDLVVDPAVAVALDPTDAPSVDPTDAELPPSVTVDPTPAELREATTGVTPAAFAVADYGSLVLPATPAGSELVSLFVDRHVAVLDAEDVVPDMAAAHERLDDDVPDAYGSAILATGPSATADMGALVKGAHGPSEVAVVLVED